MTRLTLWITLCLLLISCTAGPVHEDPSITVEQTTTANTGQVTGAAPAGKNKKYRPGGPPWRSKDKVRAKGPFPIDLASVPTRAYDPYNKIARKWKGKRMDAAVPAAEADRLRAAARNLPATSTLSGGTVSSIETQAPTPGTSFPGPDFTDCCGGGGSVPPDPELAVGPNHAIAVVNVALMIFDKTGAVLAGPTTLNSFFNGTPGCSQSLFDPNVLYDEERDRFVIAADGDGDSYCAAASQSGDPTGVWNRYGFATNVGNNFFDFPHAGIGRDAIYMGANMFGGTFVEGRVWAMDKNAMYNGQPMNVVTHSTGGRDTPQPMNLHGFAQGTWPTSGPHYVVTSEGFNGSTYSVWQWTDPFGVNTFIRLGLVNLPAAHGGSVGYPVDVPQLGGQNLQANDYRPTHAEYRNGDIWFAAGVSCNPGSGTVDCVQWGRVDPTGPTLLDAGIHGTNGEYRFFPDLAVDDCDNMAIGFTHSSASSYPSVYVNGDSGGGIESDTLLKAGEISYTAFDSVPHRWGDYTGMTIDPDGTTFWYLGEYSKNTGTSSGRWGTYIGAFSYDCGATPQPPGPPANPLPADSAFDVGVDTDVSWTAGSGAASHDVYFGTDPSPGAGELQGNQSGATFDPGQLVYSTMYYWRIDEVNSHGTTAGQVWSFTTKDAPPVDSTCVDDIQMSLVNLGKNRRADATISVTDCDGTAIDGAVISGTWETPVSSGPESAADVTVVSGIAVSSSDPVRKNRNGTFTYRVTDVIAENRDYHAGGSIRAACINTDGTPCSVDPPPLPGPAVNPDPAYEATDVALNATLGWSAGSDAESHDVYFGTDPSLALDAFQGNQIGTSYDPGPLAPETPYFWRIDEQNSSGVTTGTVWRFTTGGAPAVAGKASQPDPAHLATDVSLGTQLGWIAGENMATQNVYFGTTNAPVLLEQTSSKTADPTPGPTTLSYNTRYYWRVDTVNAADQVTTGDLWQFTTGPLPSEDTVEITRATYESGPRRLTVWATSSHQSDSPTLEVYVTDGPLIGQMGFNASTGRHEYSAKKVDNPGSVTVFSSSGGDAEAAVE